MIDLTAVALAVLPVYLWMGAITLACWIVGDLISTDKEKTVEMSRQQRINPMIVYFFTFWGWPWAIRTTLELFALACVQRWQKGQK